LSAGELDKRIEIRDFTSSLDGYGHPVQTWYTLDTVWAKIEPMAGREYWDAHKETADVDTRIKIRFRRKLKPSQRLRYGAREYKIISIINPNEDHRYTHIMCKEQVD
jgi:SPP1 family predicted phage head-tail adaptor